MPVSEVIRRTTIPDFRFEISDSGERDVPAAARDKIQDSKFQRTLPAQVVVFAGQPIDADGAEDVEGLGILQGRHAVRSVTGCHMHPLGSTGPDIFGVRPFCLH